MKKLITIIAIFGSLALTAQSRPGYTQLTNEYNKKGFRSSESAIFVTMMDKNLTDYQVKTWNTTTPEGFEWIGTELINILGINMYQTTFKAIGQKIEVIVLASSFNGRTIQTMLVKDLGGLNSKDYENAGYFHGFYLVN